MPPPTNYQPFNPKTWDGTFYIAPQNPHTLATWFETYAPQDYVAFGGSLVPYQGGTYNNQSGQVDANTEAAQLGDSLIAAQGITKNPAQAMAVEKRIKFGNFSPNDPNFFDPYWTPWKDEQQVMQNLHTASGFNDAVAALKRVGYADLETADALRTIANNYGMGYDLPSGTSNNMILAKVIGVPLLNRVLDPIWFIDPSSGQAGQTLTDWTNHVGGEWVNFALPFYNKNWTSAISYINTCLSVRYTTDQMRILMELDAQFLQLFDNVKALGVAMHSYCDQQNAQQLNGPAVTYNLGDMVAPLPLTPTQKRYLAQSKLYNAVNESPPTYGSTFILEMLAGNNPLGLSTDPNVNAAVQSDPSKTSVLANVNGFDAMVLLDWAKRLVDFNAAQPSGLGHAYPYLLDPFVKAYYQPPNPQAN